MSGLIKKFYSATITKSYTALRGLKIQFPRVDTTLYETEKIKPSRGKFETENPKANERWNDTSIKEKRRRKTNETVTLPNVKMAWTTL